MNHYFFKIISILICSFVVLTGNVLASSNEKDAHEDPVFYELPEMVVNLKSDGRSIRVLKIRLNLELSSAADIEIVDKLKPRLLHEFQLYLRHLYADDFNGSAIENLKEELLIKANYAARHIKFKEVLFRGLLVQ